MWSLIRFASVLSILTFRDVNGAAISNDSNLQNSDLLAQTSDCSCVWLTEELCRYNVGKVSVLDETNNFSCVVLNKTTWKIVANRCGYRNITESTKHSATRPQPPQIMCGDILVEAEYPFCVGLNMYNTTVFTQFCD
jgi:hypothetical protein